MIPVFDLLTATLEPGVTLIEASAGTGKTYTLAGLFFRLLTEHDLAPSQILVSTYTEAATAELRDRIRSLIQKGFQAAETGETDDEFLRGWLDSNRVAREVARERLARALRNFDEAAIHTIHGFCRRMLQDRAFESGLVFNAELLTDQDPILRELADDYWRAHFRLAEPAVTALAMAERVTAPSLAYLLGRVVSHPLIRILPEGIDLDAVRKDIANLFSEFRRQWPRWRNELLGLLFGDQEWVKQVPAKKWKVQFPLVEACALDAAASTDAYDALSAFTTEKIASAARAKYEPPEHPFFGLCARLLELRATLKAGLCTDFLQWARAELPHRKAKRNVITFDDLLTRLHDALHSSSGDALAEAIRGRFRAALIDEFQDTDAIQEAIFSKLFRNGASWLFLIGDPKQAIYGFRGADVFTYLNASAGANRFQLGTNYRSTTQLVSAVNTIFSQGARPFVIDEIAFSEVQAAGRADTKAPVGEAGEGAPFQIWRWESEKAITAKAANALLPQVVAAEAARMLASGMTIEGVKLEPSDLAVLVTTNQQARLVQAALNKVGIPNVLVTNESVFFSDEAQELHTLLAALAEPNRESFLRAALATKALGFDAASIEALQRNDLAWEAWLLRIHQYHEIWRDTGFVPMFRRLLQEEDIRSHLLRFGDGERRLTNFLHLGELLHHAAMERRLGPTALLSWFAAQRSSRRPSGDDHELRLERDEAALQIATVHKSKGLEYNIVFCPFSWADAELSNWQSVLFHEPPPERRLALDLGSDRYEDNRAVAVRERLAEQTRLFYVALTRARLQTHFIWGQFDKNAVSAANWILHPAHAADDAETMAASIEALTPDVWRGELEALAARAPQAISVIDLPSDVAPPYRFTEDEEQPLAVREFRGRIARDWRVSSFSSLTIERDAENPDHDPQSFDPPPIDDAQPEQGIHAFPRGKKAGTCLHEIFEQIDFAEAETIEGAVKKALARHGFSEAEWKGTVVKCVENVLDIALEPGLSLADVEAPARLTELEFYLPMQQLTAGSLLRVLGPEAAAGLRFEPHRGMLKGFIDLVIRREGRFYILDWKSNHLGPRADFYKPPALRDAMRQHHYGLQYHLYTLALHRYLSLRMPDYDYDTHFGGVFYVFLRGVDPANPDLGIFRDRPSRDTIEGLSLQLAGGGEL